MLVRVRRRAPLSLAAEDLLAVSNGREPDVEEEGDEGAGGAREQFQATHGGYDPLMRERRDLDRMTSEMEELFADLCQVPRLVGHRRSFRPAVDVFATEDPPALTVVVDLAGVDADDLELALADGVLVLSGTRSREPSEVRRVYQHMEIEYGRFEARIPLVHRVDAEAASAGFSRGLLRIVLPLASRASGPVRVPIARTGE